MIDKRMLKRQYLDTACRAGVYAIRNQLTGRVLVGSSTNVQAALNRHRFELRQASHRNRLLSHDWSVHGESSFSFDILDTVKPDPDRKVDIARELDELLALWRQELSCSSERDYEDTGRPS